MVVRHIAIVQGVLGLNARRDAQRSEAVEVGEVEKLGMLDGSPTARRLEGVNVSGLASERGYRLAAEIKAEVGNRIKELSHA